MTVWVVVVAAGEGARFGGPKQYEMVGNTRIIDRSTAAARRSADGVVVVVAPDRVATERDALARAGAAAVVDGASTRAGSVRCGLAAVPADAAVVLVHDAARPLASDALFERVIAEIAAGAVAVVPGVAIADTLRAVDGGTIDRSGLVAVQTPQGFAAGALRAAHRGEPDASDDAALVEAIGGKVVIVPGEPTNFKITTRADLAIARALVDAGEI